MSSTRRSLHFVLKVGNRTETAKFYKDVLGMTILRHEEFASGCKAYCNGPYAGKWSKSMVGYGSEDDHFVVELTYNYGLGTYKIGNDFRGLTISLPSIVSRAKEANYPMTTEDGQHILLAPDGYRFAISEENVDGDPVRKVTLASSNLEKSIDFWCRLVGMKVYSKSNTSAVMGYADNQCKLELLAIESKVEHATAFGRIAFSCPKDELPGLEQLMKDNGQTILTPLVSLDTPGKATVEVIIVADPDGHEICFVGEEAFKELSQVDSHADDLLTKAVEKDKSEEWFKAKGKTKGTA